MRGREGERGRTHEVAEDVAQESRPRGNGELRRLARRRDVVEAEEGLRATIRIISESVTRSKRSRAE